MAGIGIRPLGEDDPKRLGSYRLLWRLTTGGMGRIYLARARADGPLVAVKTLLAEGVVSEPDRKRFAREVELARRVDSACTARVVDADARAGRPWMAIEYVPAPSLGDLVREAGPLPPSALPWVAAGAAQALLALHDKGVVHRDVKPQNILLPLTGPLVIDFGISHAIDKTTTSLTLGTIDYTSPEQALGQRSTPASDVFSLGATLFHLAVGRAPYPEVDDGPIQRLARVQTGTLDLAGLPAELDPLIRPCLAIDPGLRPTLEDLLVSFLEKADGASGRGREQRWLPVRWTALIDAYEAHGRALDADRGAAAAMSDEHTRPVPPPAPTLLDTRERAARREREQRARETRELRQQEMRDLAEAARRAKARQSEERRKAGRPGKPAATGSAGNTGRAGKPGSTGKAGSNGGSKGSGSSGKRENTGGAGSGAGTREIPATSASTGRTDQGSSSGGGLALAVLLVLALVLLAWQPWKGGDSPDSQAGASNSSSESPSPTGGGSYATDPDTGTPYADAPETDGDSSTDATSEPTTEEPDPETSSPTPDPTEEAFKAVSVGDCLPVYDTGRRGGVIDWSADVPPTPVSCGSQWAGLVRVTSTSDSVCPSGNGKASWTYASSVSGETTKLCVSRIYLKNYCVLGKQSGDSISIGPMTAVDCRAGRVPSAYNQIMHISGVYQAPAGASARNCVEGPNDRRRYWAWLVDDGRTLLCTTIFQGS
ncbi:serine/threonine-protein kinase [Streptomyces sparsogenes]|uniref:serine/threonine-protein kinase n=1 Tax=Streptomyces sparsogenes TaxID=67365 RepID=UPI00332A8165